MRAMMRVYRFLARLCMTAGAPQLRNYIQYTTIVWLEHHLRVYTLFITETESFGHRHHYRAVRISVVFAVKLHFRFFFRDVRLLVRHESSAKLRSPNMKVCTPLYMAP